MTERAVAPLDRVAAVAHLRATACAPDGVASPRLGIEQEWHTYCLTDPARHLEPAEVLAAALSPGPLPRGSAVTVEPGGQVELATPPCDPWWDALDVLRVDGAALRDRLRAVGIATVAAGVDPFREPARTLTQPRYDAMQAYFDRDGPHGRRMMSSCAAIQLNVDCGDARTQARRWRVAHRVGPALAAAFACSPDPVSRSERLANWHAVDPGRTSPVHASGDVLRDWSTYVLAARVMLVHEADGSCRLVDGHRTFASWLDEPLAGRAPTAADLDYHCTTLFPPVRPRGWFELRWLDALPAGVAEVASAAVTALVVDDEAGLVAEEACAGLDDQGAWRTAAALGPAHPRLAAAATVALEEAAGALDRAGAPARWAGAVAEAAERWPARGRCPADDLEARLAAGADAAALADPAEEVHP